MWNQLRRFAQHAHQNSVVKKDHEKAMKKGQSPFKLQPFIFVRKQLLIQ